MQINDTESCTKCDIRSYLGLYIGNIGFFEVKKIKKHNQYIGMCLKDKVYKEFHTFSLDRAAQKVGFPNYTPELKERLLIDIEKEVIEKNILSTLIKKILGNDDK